MHILSLVIQVILGLMFLFLGISSLLGTKKALDNFNQLQLPTWFRIVTGFVQLLGAIGMLLGIFIPFYALIAGIWLGITMAVGALLHIKSKKPLSEAAPALVIMIISIFVTFLNV